MLQSKFYYERKVFIMKKMFGKISVILSLVLIVMTLSACGTKNAEAVQTESTSAESTQAAVKADVKVAALKGPTAIGMIQVMKNAKEGKADNNYGFQIAAAADEFTAELIKGNVQFAAMPCNAAAALYNKSGGKIKILGINTLGVLYILDTGKTIQSVEDLKGKTIYATGKGTTPEYTLRYLLKSAGINPDKDVTIEFKSEAAEVAALLAKAGSEDIVAMLPQPYVTTVLMNNENVRVALDVTKEWEKLNGSDSTVVTGVVVVNTEYYNNNKAVADTFIKEYEKSASYVNANVDEAAQLVEEFDIFKAAVAKKAIPDCNITFIKGSEMKNKVAKYLKVLYDENPASIGGAMPGDDFYIN